MLVIPSSLQMGWSDSPAFFCGASKMACDVAEELIKEPKGLLPPHILEPFMFPSETQSELTANLQDSMDPNTAQVEKFFGDASLTLTLTITITLTLTLTQPYGD
jgi:hypothetical protein